MKALRTLIILCLLFPSIMSAQAAPYLQGNDPEAKALALLESMQPEERVGQLLLVSFEGNQALPESRIYDLITNYHIGGVVLEREQNNFVGAPSTIEIASSLIRDLQEAESSASQIIRRDQISGADFSPVYVPLFVGISQEGDGFPNDQLLSGLSPQASAMALGATWETGLAKSAGALLGSELSSLGINLLLGPSLDILDIPRSESVGSIGVRSFGGDPFWVSKMGQAYIEGVHEGSNNQIAVVAKHLPGLGNSDRSLEDEIPTIRKSLAELTQVELVPFFAVTGDAPNSSAQTDAMLITHIRYQGFQGNIRTTTRPVSFDPQAFRDLLDLEPFAEWRINGGVIISDSLGTRAVRRNYDPSEQSFDGPSVALDAFLAGNDILYLGNFISDWDADSYATITDTANFFTQKYREDVAFADRVDQAVLRILSLKYRLYPNFQSNQILPSLTMPRDFGQNNELIVEIGFQSASLLSPAADQIAEVMPAAPQKEERIVFIIDSFGIRQCDDCEEIAVQTPADFEQAVERLYGPDAGDRIAPGNVSSYSFRELQVALDTPAGEENILLGNLDSADWVVFGILEEDEERQESLALEQLLGEQSERLLDKSVVVFSLNAPLFLDATEVTKLSAYYALYGKDKQFADIAARLLFQEINAPGAPPITVLGTGYNLLAATSPDPLRVIPIFASRVLLDPNGQIGESEDIPQVTESADENLVSIFQLGDLLEIIVGPIIDHNGNPVPDNTPITITITTSNEESSASRAIELITSGALASTSYSIENEDNIEIRASSGNPPALSEVLNLEIIGVNAEGLALQLTQSAAISTEENQSSELPPESSSDQIVMQNDGIQLVDWFLAILVSVFVALVAYQIGSAIANVRWGIRWALSALIGGFATTSYLTLKLPGSEQFYSTGGIWGITLLTVLASIIGWGFAWIWRISSTNKASSSH